MENPKVSVLVTFYNQEKYVDKALNSVFSQNTNFDYDVLIGDDGSSDRTLEIINQWISRYPNKIRLFQMERLEKKYPTGFRASQNRINLLKHVTGQYFNFLDGDDYFTDNDKLQKQIEILDSEDNQDCIACGSNIDMIFPDGTIKQATSNKLQKGKISPSDYWKRHYFHTDTLLIRSSVIAKLPIKLLENTFNDNLITYSIIQHGNLYYIPESTAAYIQTMDGIWTTSNNETNQIREMICYDICNIINPTLKKETDKRLTGSWVGMRKIIMNPKSDISKIMVFDNEIKDKKLKNSFKFVHYNELPLFQKLLFSIKIFAKTIRPRFYEFRNKLKQKLTNYF